MLSTDPVNRALDLACCRSGLGSRASLGIVSTAKLNNLARSILNHFIATDDVAVSQSNFCADGQAEELLGGVLHEVIAFDKQVTREWNLPCPR